MHTNTTVCLKMANALLLFWYIVFISAIVNSDTVGYYSIPEPKIVAFEGGGLRIILDDESGISSFIFHGNINDELKQLFPGTINIETSTQISGKWILEDKSIKLLRGDVLYYWLFVEKDRLGYVKQPVKFKIREVVSYYDEEIINTTESNIPQTSPTTLQAVAHQTSLTTTTEHTPTTPFIFQYPTTNAFSLSSLQSQIDTLNQKLNLITSVTALQGQVDALAKNFDVVSNSAALQDKVKNISTTLDAIMSILEALPDAKRLTLSGFIPPDQGSNPTQVVQLVLWEKLDLQMDVVSAVRSNDGAIAFELKTIQQKFDVLRAAAEKLKNSRIVIS